LEAGAVYVAADAQRFFAHNAGTTASRGAFFAETQTSQCVKELRSRC
jgi:hypothetical protein